MSVTDPHRVAGLYQDTRQRIAALLDDHGDATWGAPVPACPGWSVGDVTSHEHDIRGALGRPGDRGSEAVRYSSNQVLSRLNTSVPLRVTVEDAGYRCGPEAAPELRLMTTRFEALRWRTGRRSHAQILAMDWSADPTPIIGELCLFGPATADLVE